MGTDTWRELKEADKPRIACAHNGCDKHADECNTLQGRSFFYFCREHAQEIKDRHVCSQEEVTRVRGEIVASSAARSPA